MSPVGSGDGVGVTAGDGSHGDPDDGTDDPRPTGEVAEAKVPHSALAGLMAEPVSRSVPVRRSTVLMLVAFLGFGTLMYLYPPTTKTFTTYTTNNPNGLPTGLVPAPASTTTTAPPSTTTTTAPSASTTTSSSTTSTTSGVSTTTTTSQPSASTSTTVGSTTTTTRVGTATTSTTSATSAAP